MTLRVLALDSSDIADWNAYVDAASGASLYHDIGWRQVIEGTFGHRTYYLVCREGSGRVAGVLPLVLLDSLLFGRFLVSMPYFNYGGVCADRADAATALLREAAAIAAADGARHVELRHVAALPELPGGLWSTRSEKVAMRLALPGDSALLWSALASKLRSQIRRPQKDGMEARVGGLDQLDAFYDVFATNMRDLGTPVYPRRFFRAVLDRFPDRAAIVAVYHRRRAVAAGFLLGFRDTLEIPWASSLRAYNHSSPNMLLYWRALEFACAGGYRVFDFGRSSPDAGTCRFKEQWGATPVPLQWQYWAADGRPPANLSPSNRKFRVAIGVWRRLPVGVTRLLGPSVIRGLPG